MWRFSLSLVVIVAFLALYGCAADVDELNQTVVRNRTYDYARTTVQTPKQLVVPAGMHVDFAPVNPQVPYNLHYKPLLTVNIGPPMYADKGVVAMPSVMEAAWKKKLAALEAELQKIKASSQS